ncbi:MAG: hypothetical protein VB084_11425 [Syntrophomonadaceae bacterium]|nr:hypothetical protein [Syntrophomonadaceae bacterium]
MNLPNCWEFKRCGREIGGHNTEELGVCPVAQCIQFDGANDGHNAGRLCWAILGTLCDGAVQNEFEDKLKKCLRCDFYIMTFTEYFQNLADYHSNCNAQKAGCPQKL